MSTTTPTDKDQMICGKIVEYLTMILQATNDEDNEEKLKDLRALLIAASRENIRNVADRFPLDEMFTKMNSLPELSEIIVSIFSMFLDALYGPTVLKHLSSAIACLDLNSGNQEIKVLWMSKVILPVFNHDMMLGEFHDNSQDIKPLVCALAKLLVLEAPKIWYPANCAILAFAKKYPDEYFHPSIQEQIQKVYSSTDVQSKFKLADSDTIRVRFFQLIADISQLSAAHMKFLQSEKMFDLVKDFDIEHLLVRDPIVSMNILKILTFLVDCPHTRDHLKSANIPSILADYLDSPANSTYLTFTEPSVIAFLFRYSVHDIEFLRQHEKIVLKMLGWIENYRSTTNNDHLFLALESFAYLAGTEDGKKFVNSYQDRIFPHLFEIIARPGEEIHVRALMAVCDFFAIPKPDPEAACSTIVNNWLVAMNTDHRFITRLIKLAREPFADVRLKAMDVLKTLASTAFGQKELTRDKQFEDWLLDRKTESDSVGREAKWAVVQTVCMSPFVRMNFNAKTQLNLRSYYKDGPKDPVVAVESESAA